MEFRDSTGQLIRTKSTPLLTTAQILELKRAQQFKARDEIMMALDKKVRYQIERREG